MKHIHPNLYYIGRFLSDFVPLYPFYILLMQQRALEAHQIAIALAYWSAVVVITEIPLGIVSDILMQRNSRFFNRRSMIVLGYILKSSTFVIWLFSQAFWGILLGFLLWGISESTLSGTTEAWLFESLEQKGDHPNYNRIKGRGEFFSGLGISASALLGGALAMKSLEPVIICSLVTSTLGAITMVFQPNPGNTPLVKHQEKKPNHSKLSGKKIPRLVFFASLVLVVPCILEEWDPLLLKQLDFTPFYIGLVISLRYVFESLGAGIAHWFNGFFKSQRRIAQMSFLLVPPLLLLGFYEKSILLPLYGLYYFLWGILGVQAEGHIQRQAQGGGRATLLSVKSLIENLVGITMMLAMGGLVKGMGLTFLWTACALWLLVGSIAGSLFIKRN